MSALAIRAGLLAARARTDVLQRRSLPAAWRAAWQVPAFVPMIAVTNDRALGVGGIGLGAAALFDLFSTARSAPANTYFVTKTGSDATGTGASGAPFGSIHKAVATANATGQPAMIRIEAGDYPRQTGFSNSGTILPTVDIAFIAFSGVVTTGAYDEFPAPAIDATQTNTYSYAVGNVNKVLDRTRLDRFGNMVELRNVPSAAACNARPDSWAAVGNATLYINRGDGAAVTNANTRVMRATVAAIKIDAPISVFWDGNDVLSGFDVQGGNDVSGLFYGPGSTPATMKAVVADKTTFRYGGGALHTATRGVYVDGIHGVAAFFNCRSDGNASDGFSAARNTLTASIGHFVTVNCSARDNGRAPNQSNNGWTLHGNVVGLDVCGRYQDNHGGSVRPIADTMSLLVGTLVRDDRGDVAFGGTMPPTAVQVDQNAQAYLDRCVIDQPAGGLALFTAGAASAIYTRDMPPLRAATGGSGIIGRW